MADRKDFACVREHLVNRARAVLGGQAIEPRDILKLAKDLKNIDEFGYARKLFDRARNVQDAAWNDAERLDLAQQLALSTYKDPDLPADQKYARALDLLRKECNLNEKEMRNRETLGLAGAIYKRRWEGEGQRQFLEKSCYYYLRGCQNGIGQTIEENPGYNEINAAFVLDLLADLEARAIDDGGAQLESVVMRRARADELRQKILTDLGALIEREAKVATNYWALVTMAEASYGLGLYEEGRTWLERAFQGEGLLSWQIFSTTRQLVRLVELRRQGDTEHGLRLLGELLEKAGLQPSGLAIRDTSTEKVGLALSGGGFRASLFHIGVLAKLADIGVLNRIEALSCVSGGSIIGAHYYLELRRLYEIEQKTDADLSAADYIGVVKNLERDFLAGVRKNIRTRVVSSVLSNIRMIFSRDYSRTLRVGELYEKHIYARVEDRQGHAPRWLDELRINPIDEKPGSFNPRQDNWRRRNKIPILILNATSLNTGHVWQFTASYMGEPPAAINTEIDASYRLRRMYYPDAPALYRNEEGAKRRVRLGYAVASSSCVPGMFEPLALPSLYPDKTVQLVDGGVFDNQGTASLLEQECSVLLVSDASGQMTTEDYPTTGILGVVMRASLISQERIRWTQYRELEARRRSGQLKDLMFIHLKKDLDADPADWLDCPDPYDATSDARPLELRGPLTRYGVRKDLQRLLAAVRTDLDSFSDGEAYALMASGYLMTEYQFSKCRGSFPGVTDDDLRRRGSWLFLDYEETLTKPGLGEKLKSLLGVASESVFKIWHLSRSLHVTLELLKTGLLGGLVWLIFWYFKNPGRIPTDLFERPLVSVTFGAGKGPFTLKVGWVLITLLSLLLGKVFGDRVMKVASWPDTIRRAVTGVVAATLGGLLSGLHLLVFDRLYLRWGRTHRLIDLRKRRKDDC